MAAYYFHEIDAHCETRDDSDKFHKPSSNLKLFGLIRRKMLLITI